MPQVTFLHPEGRSGEVDTNTSLLEASKLLGFVLNHDCGGNASCTTCRVEVQVGAENLSEIDFDEQDLLDREAKVAGIGNEAEAMHVRVRIVAITAAPPGRRRDETDLLIMPDHSLRHPARL